MVSPLSRFRGAPPACRSSLESAAGAFSSVRTGLVPSYSLPGCGTSKIRAGGMDKRSLSESDICDLFISPAIRAAGWDPMTQIRREVTLTPGPVVVRGNVASRNKKKSKFADYILYQEAGVPVAVVEAKDNQHTVSHGLQQALGYAEILDVPSAYSSNGDAFASHNKVPAAGEDIETQFPLDAFPAPGVLWRRYKTHRGIKDAEEPLVLQPYHEDASGKKEPRYYQADAINRTIEAVAAGQYRVLLVMAPANGLKSFISAWSTRILRSTRKRARLMAFAFHSRQMI